MILNGNTIKNLTNKQELIKNAKNENIHSSSYDVTSSKYILQFEKSKESISLIDATSLDKMYKQVDITNGYELKPNECILVPLEEEFNIPNNVCAHIRGRTSYNRLGIFITIQHLNPGYQGKLNITIKNCSNNTYILMPYLNIAQIVFEYLDTVVNDELLYPNELYPLYQHENGLNGSKIYTHFIGKVVRHFKGNYYYIENISMDSETKNYVIVYKNLYDRTDSNLWTRPAKMFFEEIDPNRPDNITKQTHRFEVVHDLTKDYTKKES